ncbi:MAG: CPBP family intramembrane glutamic endopeptidase [Chloroherpetonaceae bacterium]
MNFPKSATYNGFWERQGFSPVAVNFIVLACLFFLYQIVGGVIAFLLAGGSITDENVVLHRLLQTLFQILFLALPVLLLVGLHTGKFSPLDSENRAFLALNQSVSREVIVWGVLGAMVLNPFLSYVGDVQFVLLSEGFGLKEEVRQWKKLFDDVVEKLASAESVGELIVVVGVVALTPAICEEVVFRGLLQQNFSRVMSPIRSVVWTGAIFGVYHLNPIQTLPLVAIGIYISYLRQSSGALWLCVAAHFAFNFFSVLGIFILNNAEWFGLSKAVVQSFKTSEPELLSPMGISSAAISLGLFVVVFRQYQRALAATHAKERQQENPDRETRGEGT